MKASDILEALKRKHVEDIFVPQCKTGPSYGNPSLGIFDAWVMLKSWANSNFIGYEVKVDRSDFINDNKWPKYLPYCNSFYFVCPKGVIQETEVPEGAGLYYCSLPSHKLMMKRKAPYREIAAPIDLFMYIMMCRVRIKDDTDQVSSRAFWEGWLKERVIDWDIGHRVSKGIRKTIEKEIDSVKSANRDLKYEVEKFQHVVAVLNELGLDPESSQYRLGDEIRKKLEALNRGCPEGLLDSLNRAITELTSARGVLLEANNTSKKLKT